ncbi:ROK family protein [Helcobacillus massiliensis]
MTEGLTAAVSTLLTCGALSRTELAEITGYSQSSMTTPIKTLLGNGYVQEIGQANSTGGRPRTLLQFRRSAVRLTVIGIQSGDIVVRQVDLDQQIYAQIRRPLDLGDPGQSLIAAIEALHSVTTEPSRCVVLSLPGVVSEEGYIALAPELGDADQATLAERLRSALRIAVIIENDVNLVALGECGRFDGDAALIYVGGGIGGALLVDGKIHVGATRSAGEIGFLPWRSSKLSGEVGQLESEFSIPRLTRGARELGIDTEEHRLLEDLMTSENDAAKGLLSGALDAWAYASAVYVCVANPHTVVLAGALPRLDKPHRSKLKSRIRRLCPSDVDIRFAQHGEDALVRGAISCMETRPQLLLEASGPPHSESPKSGL